MLWKPDEHSLEENLRWAHLRAMEWLTWPNFISQPIVPILLYFYPWPWVIGSVVLISFPWRMVVAPVVVSPTLADAGVWFVKSRWVTSPIMAFLIWQTTDDYLTAALALFWPLVGAAIVIYAVGLLRMPLSLIFPAWGRATEIGAVQRQFMAAVGYVREG
jgi:hypothetical protein